MVVYLKTKQKTTLLYFKKTRVAATPSGEMEK